MGLWDDFMIRKLPDDLRADVLKTKISETEETKRERIANSDHNITKRVLIIFGFFAVIAVCITTGYCVDEWSNVKVQEMHQRGR